MASPVMALVVKCRICRVRLGEEDDMARQICSSCVGRPEARRLGPATPATSARAFTPAEKALIQKLHGHLPMAQLLALLNERLHADLGPDAADYTLEQLHEETRGALEVEASSDWASLRRLLTQARKSGTLAAATPAVVDDFAAVFQLSPAQVTHLKDVLAHAREER